MEGAILRRQIVRVIFAALFALLCGLVATVGLAFVVWSIYQYAALSLGPPGAALACGLSALALAALFAVFAKALTR